MLVIVLIIIPIIRVATRDDDSTDAVDGDCANDYDEYNYDKDDGCGWY